MKYSTFGFDGSFWTRATYFKLIPGAASVITNLLKTRLAGRSIGLAVFFDLII